MGNTYMEKMLLVYLGKKLVFCMVDHFGDSLFKIDIAS